MRSLARLFKETDEAALDARVDARVGRMEAARPDELDFDGYDVVTREMNVLDRAYASHLATHPDLKAGERTTPLVALYFFGTPANIHQSLMGVPANAAEDPTGHEWRIHDYIHDCLKGDMTAAETGALPKVVEWVQELYKKAGVPLFSEIVVPDDNIWLVDLPQDDILATPDGGEGESSYFDTTPFTDLLDTGEEGFGDNRRAALKIYDTQLNTVAADEKVAAIAARLDDAFERRMRTHPVKVPLRHLVPLVGAYFFDCPVQEYERDPAIMEAYIVERSQELSPDEEGALKSVTSWVLAMYQAANVPLLDESDVPSRAPAPQPARPEGAVTGRDAANILEFRPRGGQK